MQPVNPLLEERISPRHGFVVTPGIRGLQPLGDCGEMREHHFTDHTFGKESAKALNALIHPLVATEQIEWMAAEEQKPGDRIVMVEATLLIEAGGEDRFERIIVVDADPETQLARAVARGMTREEASRRIAHQMPRHERLQHADYVIDNSSDLGAAEAETRLVYEELLRDLAERR